MKRSASLALAALLTLASAGCVRETRVETVSDITIQPPARTDATLADAAKPLPKLVNLGADKCIPCKQMVPVRNALAAEYAGQIEVSFIDIMVNREAGERHGIRIIPTQIILAADGTELFRHEGYWPKEEIIARFAALGIPLIKPEAPAATDNAPDPT